MQGKGGLLINKINFLSGRVFNKILRNHEQLEINHAQARILFIIYKNNNQLTIQNLATELSVSKSTLTTMIERLVNKGYLLKQISPHDKRVSILSTTEKALAEIEHFEKTLQQMSTTFYRGFTVKEIELFENFLERVHSNLEND